MAEEATFDFDIEAVLTSVLLELGHLAERSAEILADELRQSIPISDEAAAPYMPPHSRGPFRDSFKSTTARRERKARKFVTAWTYSLAVTEQNESLARILDEGRGSIHPHPFIRAALDRAKRRMGREVEAVQQQLQSGA